jgi:hypothetical protein
MYKNFVENISPECKEVYKRTKETKLYAHTQTGIRVH